MSESVISTGMASAPVIAAIGLGANLGDARAALHAAVRALGDLPGTRLIAQSAHYRSAPVDADGPDYINAAALVETTLAPLELLVALQNVERRYGRERSYRNAPRTLDLDLLLWGDAHIDLPQLQVPHPRGHQRAFVLAPLLELCPAGVWPGQGALADLLAAVQAGEPQQRIRRLT